MAKNWHEYTHQDTSINTISAFINNANSLVKSFIGRETEFINYKDEDTGITNAELIWNVYTVGETENYPSASTLDVSAPLLPDTPLMIPKDDTNNEMLSIKGKDLYTKQQDFKTFVNEEFQEIENDPLYIRDNRIESISGDSDINVVELSFQVWVYMKALDKIINVSNFVSSLNTNKSKEGSFSISLSAVENLDDLLFNNNGTDTINYTNTKYSPKLQPAETYVNDSFFHRYVQYNDIVFIRFEKLQIENDRNEESPLEIPKSDLPNAIFDMIGLVDTNSQSYNPVINSLDLTITGRDFTKLLTEDGSFFFPYSLVEGSENFFINSQTDNKYEKRLFVNSKLAVLFAYSHRSIRDTLGFIFNQLTNVGTLPPDNDLFNAYGDSRAKTYDVSGAGDDVLDAVEQNGVWQIVKLLSDSQLDNRRIADSSITKPDGTLLSQINKICQMPFVEFWGETYGSFFNFIARQPPFRKSQILDYIDNKLVIDIDGRDIDDYSSEWEDEYYSIYQINPQDNFLGNVNFIALAHVPVVYFPEFINAFGNNRLSVPDHYVSYQALYGNKKKTNADLFKSFIANDFKYIIESNFYLPFTRKGSFTIKGGDRRIKRGMWIRLKFTGEIAYVDSVSNSATASNSDINRETVVQYSRAMKEFNLVNDFGVSLSGGESTTLSPSVNLSENAFFTPTPKTFNYFDIVNVDVVEDLLLAGLTGNDISSFKEKSQLIVNKDAFNYFLTRQQMNDK